MSSSRLWWPSGAWRSSSYLRGEEEVWESRKMGEAASCFCQVVVKEARHPRRIDRMNVKRGTRVHVAQESRLGRNKTDQAPHDNTCD